MLTVPNSITIFRLAAVPLIVWFSCSHRTGELAAAAGLFTLAAVSDWLDGYLARRLKAPSRLGTLLDPLVDKVLVLSVLFVFSARRLLPLWLVLLLLFREAGVTAARHALSTAAEAVGANWMGKAKFVLQVLLIELGYAHLLLESLHKALPGGKPLFFWSAAAVTALSYAFLFRFLGRHGRTLLSHRPDGTPASQ